jgi:hypothetical protein
MLVRNEFGVVGTRARVPTPLLTSVVRGHARLARGYNVRTYEVCMASVDGGIARPE